MKTKENVETKLLNFDRPIDVPRPKSLRPLRSLVALRSLKPKTCVAPIAIKEQEGQKRD